MFDLPSKAISIRQPWAWAIVHAGKDIENRDWPTRFRGPVCIHAAKGMTNREYEDANGFVQAVLGERPSEWLMQWHGVTAAPYKLERGGIIGVAEVVDCVAVSDSPWFMGRYGFVLRNVRSVPFVPVKGALGFFDWRSNLTASPQPLQDRDANHG